MPKPNLHDYATLEAYLEALVDWKLAQYDGQWLRTLGIDPEGDPPSRRGRRIRRLLW